MNKYENRDEEYFNDLKYFILFLYKKKIQLTIIIIITIFVNLALNIFLDKNRIIEYNHKIQIGLKDNVYQKENYNADQLAHFDDFIELDKNEKSVDLININNKTNQFDINSDPSTTIFGNYAFDNFIIGILNKKILAYLNDNNISHEIYNYEDSIVINFKYFNQSMEKKIILDFDNIIQETSKSFNTQIAIYKSNYINSIRQNIASIFFTVLLDVIKKFEIKDAMDANYPFDETFKEGYLRMYESILTTIDKDPNKDNFKYDKENRIDLSSVSPNLISKIIDKINEFERIHLNSSQNKSFWGFQEDLHQFFSPKSTQLHYLNYLKLSKENYINYLREFTETSFEAERITQVDYFAKYYGIFTFLDNFCNSNFKNDYYLSMKNYANCIGIFRGNNIPVIDNMRDYFQALRKKRTTCDMNLINDDRDILYLSINDKNSDCLVKYSFDFQQIFYKFDFSIKLILDENKKLNNIVINDKYDYVEEPNDIIKTIILSIIYGFIIGIFLIFIFDIIKNQKKIKDKKNTTN